MMFAVLVGCAARVAMAAEQRPQAPFAIIDLGVGAAQLRRAEELGEVEDKMDRHQRVEGERDEAEPRGPNPASPFSYAHSVTSAVGVLIPKPA
jgi:hypothetical protein